jgi:hypothetical protein
MECERLRRLRLAARTVASCRRARHDGEPMEPDSNTVAIVAIAVTGGTALLTALVAAATAHRRQTTQLAHERLVRDLDEARKSLDEAAITLNRFFFTITDVVGDWIHRDHLAREKYAAAQERLAEVVIEGERLRLRFGVNHPVADSYWDAHETCRRLLTLPLLGALGAQSDVEEAADRVRPAEDLAEAATPAGTQTEESPEAVRERRDRLSADLIEDYRDKRSIPTRSVDRGRRSPTDHRGGVPLW